MKISFCPAKKEDYNNLWNLHKATMKKYVDQTWGWEEEFQKEYFQKHFDPEGIQIIDREGAFVGAIQIQDKKSEIFIAKIEISPKFQNQGIGTTILEKIIETLQRTEKPVRLQVLKVNPAKKLYKRLGFETVRENETHFIMKRSTGE